MNTQNEQIHQIPRGYLGAVYDWKGMTHAFIYVNVHIYICMYTHIYICIYIYTCKCTYIYICMYIYIDTYVNAYI